MGESRLGKWIVQPSLRFLSFSALLLLAACVAPARCHAGLWTGSAQVVKASSGSVEIDASVPDQGEPLHLTDCNSPNQLKGLPVSSSGSGHNVVFASGESAELSTELHQVSKRLGPVGDEPVPLSNALDGLLDPPREV
jgi:hypothetical protein